MPTDLASDFITQSPCLDRPFDIDLSVKAQGLSNQDGFIMEVEEQQTLCT